MRPIPLLLLASLAAAACPGAKPETVSTPQPNADSLAALQRAHDDSVRAAERAQARATEERLAEQHRADSLAAAARTSDRELRRAWLGRVQPRPRQPPRPGGATVPCQSRRRGKPHRDDFLRQGAAARPRSQRGGLGEEPQRSVLDLDGERRVAAALAEASPSEPDGGGTMKSDDALCRVAVGLRGEGFEPPCREHAGGHARRPGGRGRRDGERSGQVRRRGAGESRDRHGRGAEVQGRLRDAAA